MTSRINWAIQSSGVDYLHMLIVSMDYLIRRFNLEARLAISVHDEIRYLVKDEDKYKAAMALQVANIWTRAMFSQQVGIDDLPQVCAFFTAVDIDHVLRKEVDMDCITPSHPRKIPHGESLDISALLAKGAAAFLDPSTTPKEGMNTDLLRFNYTPRPTVMSSLQSSNDVRYIRAQITSDDKELRAIIKEAEAESTAAHSSPSGNGPDNKTSGTVSKPITGAKRGRKPKPKVPAPPYAQPQRAVLMEVEDRWGAGYKRAFAGASKPWWAIKESTRDGGWDAGRWDNNDGWEV